VKTMTFNSLLHPLGPDEFVRDYWEKRTLILARGDRSYYGDLFSRADVDSLIFFGGTRFPDAEVQRTDSPRVMRGVPSDGRNPTGNVPLTLQDIESMYCEGKTVLVHAVQTRIGPVAQMCRSLEGSLNHPVNANMYFTPPGAQGFQAHFDDHDVFILQIDGSKNWKIYEAVRELPLKSEDPQISEDQMPPCTEQVCLQPGDLLYLPRGFVHEAFTSESASLHLTIGVEVLRWADLLTRAVTHFSRHEVALRRSLPVGWADGRTEDSELRSQLRELLQLLGEKADPDEPLADFRHEFISNLQPLPTGLFGQNTSLTPVQTGDLVQKRPGTICRVLEEGNSVSILFPSSKVSGPATIATALRVIAATEGPFTTASLPDELSETSKMVLVRRLIKEGLLLRVTSDVSGKDQ
jgi:ribosomal protein L16 Arg81 hydroxylase